ncbi:MAG: UDPGP type 1 family protein, partial [Lentisphaeria bacterium]|nr:UDPGP type 1 family protein [Lentisphaeria bacterium]
MAISDTLKQYGQLSLIAALEKAAPADKAAIEKQLDAINWAELDRLIKEYVFQKPETAIPDDLTPAPFFPFPANTDALKARYAEAEKVGNELLAQGKVAALIVAGGQGTRLGFNAPKGTYPIGPVSGKSLFGYFAESLLRA